MSKAKEDNGGILTVEELTALEAEVQREIDKEQKTKAKAALKAEMLRKARIDRGLMEANELVEINLPEDSDRIVLNGRAFMHGRSYDVPISVAMQFREVMSRAWENQAIVEGRRKDYYTKRQTRMSGLTGQVTNAPFLRA